MVDCRGVTETGKSRTDCGGRAKRRGRELGGRLNVLEKEGNRRMKEEDRV